MSKDVYHPLRLFSNHDLAIIEVFGRIEYNENVSKIELADEDFPFLVGDKVEATGYGRSSIMFEL